MHEIIVSNGYSVSERIDLDAILLPGGIRANALTREALYAELAELRIPGVRGDMGKQEMLVALARHQRAST